MGATDSTPEPRHPRILVRRFGSPAYNCDRAVARLRRAAEGAFSPRSKPNARPERADTRARGPARNGGAVDRIPRHAMDASTDSSTGHRPALHKMDRSEWSLNPQVPGSNPGGRTIKPQVRGSVGDSLQSTRCQRPIDLPAGGRPVWPIHTSWSATRCRARRPGAAYRHVGTVSGGRRSERSPSRFWSADGRRIGESSRRGQDFRAVGDEFHAPRRS